MGIMLTTLEIILKAGGLFSAGQPPRPPSLLNIVSIVDSMHGVLVSVPIHIPGELHGSNSQFGGESLPPIGVAAAIATRASSGSDLTQALRMIAAR